VLPSLRLGQYIVEGLLGPGGVTETYLAHLAPDASGKSAKEMAGKLFALKLLRADRVGESDYAQVAQRFLTAARQLRDFHRPGFGRVVDVSEDPAVAFIVTEHVAGRDLARVLEQSRAARVDGAGIDPVLAGLIGSEVARLLQVGHAAKPILCHLGLAPQNVMVTESGEVVLLDFGIASALRAITEQPAECWSFVAPELQGVDMGTAGLDDRHGVAADLYSLGALIHFLVTGQAPVVASPHAQVARRITIPDIPGVSSNLGAALRTLLSHEPEDRPSEASVLVEWLAGGVESARDRQLLIAKGLRALETGVSQSSASPRAAQPEETHAPPPVKSPGLVGAKSEVALAAKPPAAATISRRRGIFAGIALALFAAALALFALGRWAGPKRTTLVRDPATWRMRSPEMQPLAPKPGGEPAPAVRTEEPRLAEPTLGESVLSRVAGHLIAETVPPGAMVWVDGVLKGKTFADIVVGEGGHRIVLVAAGHRMFRDVVDTSQGAIIRRTLVPIEPPTHGNGSIAVDCRTSGKLPILLDEEETGLLCPTKMLPTTAGKHLVGIFVPQERRTLSVETTVEIGSKPAVVTFSE
jgi:serine/threonine protein kinase